jgi:hypothetical protein
MSRARSSMSSTAAFAVALGLVATIGPTASAATPSNDDRGAATVVADLPFTDSLDTTDATAQPNDPDCYSDAANPTVWYSFTPGNDATFIARTAGSDYDTTLLVATAGDEGLDVIDCNDDWDEGSLVAWAAKGGQEYLLMVGSFFGDPGGQLQFEIRRAPPRPSFALRLARSGTINRHGAAVVSGILRCQGTRGRQTVELSGRQDVGRLRIRGFGSGRVRCGVPWSVRVRSDAFRFGPGGIVVRAAVPWCTVIHCGTERARRVVRLP